MDSISSSRNVLPGQIKANQNLLTEEVQRVQFQYDHTGSTIYNTSVWRQLFNKQISKISLFNYLVTRYRLTHDIINGESALPVRHRCRYGILPVMLSSVKPWFIIPVIIPPAMFITVIIRPATASPLTYLVAPSMEPKKAASS